MQLPTEAAMIGHVQDFCAFHSMTVSQFGLESVGDCGFMTRLKKGRSPTLKTARRVYTYMKTKNDEVSE